MSKDARIWYTFKQNYHNWTEPCAMIDNFTARVNTFDILEALDRLEVEVYADREFSLANEMLESIKL